MIRRTDGFTLLELLIVVGIVGILAALSIGQIRGTLPNSRLNEATGEVQTAMLRTRMDAIRSYRYEKLCLFRDPNALDDQPAGMVRHFQCETTGDDGCDTNLICANVDATATLAAQIEPTASVTCGVAGNWCEAVDKRVDYTDTYYLRYHISILGFADSPGDPAPETENLNALEITYSPLGTVNTGRTTEGGSDNSYAQGVIFVTNYDHCLPGVPPAGTCTSFSRTGAVSYVLGGPVKTRSPR